MTDVYSQLGTRNRATPQSERAETEQVENHAGGFVFKLDDEAQLRRFLILGTASGTYYASAKDHTKANAAIVEKMAKAGDMALVKQIEEVSLNGLAAKQQPTLVALAYACASPNDELRKAALALVPQVCRTFTMLATFLGYVKNQRGMGRGLRNAIAEFYEGKTANQLALQVVKYRQREGYTHRDVLRIAHPDAPTDEHRAIYDWACGRPTEFPLPEKIVEFDKAQAAEDVPPVVASIKSAGLPWEAVPDKMVNEPKVLETLLPEMGATALIRQLPRFARAGMTGGHFTSPVTEQIVAKLTDEEFIKRGRIHPFQALQARLVYANGSSGRGDGWTPARPIIDALEQTYELSFQNIVPSGTRTGVFLDVSGSMGWDMMGTLVTARDGSAAMAMATLRSEPYTLTAAFTSSGGAGMYAGTGYGRKRKPNLDGISLLDISKTDSLSQVIGKVSRLPFGGTDCALPMIWAMENEPTLETFVVYTDNETWAGSIHPHQALQKYRKQTGINAKLIVVGMTSTGFSIADPSDPGMLDVVGFDSSAPRVMAEFAAGRL